MDKSMTVGVIGAGTMGIGIAQVAAQAGHNVVLYDAREDVVKKAVADLLGTLDKLAAKGKISGEEAAATHGRIKPVNNLKALSGCGLVMEAIVEDLAIKKKVFADLEKVTSAGTILATNTSSLSITAIAAACSDPSRIIGLHFFNPAPILPLVEVVPGLATDPKLVAQSSQLMASWKKVPVICKDTPGFIVNRVARPFYGEALRIHEEGIADIPAIDRAMKEIGGFKMGPFELMDLIGNDINFAVTESVFRAFFFDPRYKPSITQQRMVEAGWLGRKSGRGYYRYDQGQEQGQEQDHARGQEIVERILVMLINEAAEALNLGIASRDDIDLAMTKGVSYPKGLLKWADEKGIAECLTKLEALEEQYSEDRYRPSPLLRRMAREGTTFY